MELLISPASVPPINLTGKLGLQQEVFSFESEICTEIHGNTKKVLLSVAENVPLIAPCWTKKTRGIASILATQRSRWSSRLQVLGKSWSAWVSWRKILMACTQSTCIYIYTWQYSTYVHKWCVHILVYIIMYRYINAFCISWSIWMIHGDFQGVVTEAHADGE